MDLPGRTTFTVTADVVASFDSPEALWKLAITLGDIRQGEGPGRGVEVDTDGDGVAEADPQLRVAMGAAASIRVRPGACTGAKQVVVHESLTQFGVYRFGPIVAEVSPGGHTWPCADGDDPGEWQPIELTVEGHADAMLAAPFEVGVRHDVYTQRPAHQPWQPLVLQGDLVRLEVEASQTLASVTGLAVEADDSDRPRVSWNAVAGAGAYQVQWRWGSEGYGRWHKENGATSSREKRVTGTSHTVAVPSAAKRAEGLTVRVRAYDGDALTVGPWREAVLGLRRVLVQSTGEPLTQKIVQNRVAHAARLAGVRPGVHILRHTFCLHLAMRGAPARAIQDLAGHQDLTTTQRYMHLSPAAIEGAIRLLDASRTSTACGNMLATGSTESDNCK